MTEKNSRAQRRHDRARLKKKRQYHWGYGHKDEWIGRTPDVAGDINYMSPKLAGMVVNAPGSCSCYMCGNPRRAPWAEHAWSMQERKAWDAAIDGIEEYVDMRTYRWEKYDYFYNDWDLWDYGQDPADDWYLRWMYIKG